uniref:GlsB/YeaQ/YmgE family stress response membrane protein n=1 Tax=uncultured Sphingomonas sp. TaxID=158754 RepID=UPI0025DE21C5|nr:GlsB/YeaQ/YmgE family stress response membrane protein [uncultured Sphingomonas sp.]
MFTWAGLVVLSALLGWVASVVWRAATGREILLSIGAGVVGGVLGGLLLAPQLGGGSIASGGAFSLPNLLISLLGAILLLTIVHLLRRVGVRSR